MNKTFLFTLPGFFLCLFLSCRNGVTDESNVIAISNNIDNGLPAQGLTAYYPFNGNADDASGNGNDGVNQGAALTSDRFGHKNSAYHFAGGAYIRIPDLFSDAVSGFTFAAWVMKDTLDSNNHEIIFKGPNQGKAAMGIVGSILGFGVCLGTDPNNWYSVDMPDTLKAKKWHFVVGRYTKGQKVELLFNGNLIGSLALPDISLYQIAEDPNNYSAIGTVSNQANYYWVGVLDDIRVYNRALSDAEVQSLYHEGGWSGN